MSNVSEGDWHTKRSFGKPTGKFSVRASDAIPEKRRITPLNTPVGIKRFKAVDVEEELNPILLEEECDDSMIYMSVTAVETGRETVSALKEKCETILSELLLKEFRSEFAERIRDYIKGNDDSMSGRNSQQSIQLSAIEKLLCVTDYLINIRDKFKFIVKIRPITKVGLDEIISWKYNTNSIELIEGYTYHMYKIDAIWENSVKNYFEINLRCDDI